MIHFRNTLIGFCLLLSLNILAGNIKNDVRVEQNFNFDWKFQLGDNPEFREPAYNDTQWRTLNVPHDWSIEGDYQPNKYLGNKNGYFPEGIGWYRKTFTVDASKSNKQIVIQFDGVYMNSEVYINGRFCGRRPYGYATFQYDLTANIKFGKENVIAVRVDNSVPAASRWYAGSGIYRNVHLIETNYVHFRGMDGVYVTTPIAEKERAIVKADYTISASFFDDAEIKTYKKNKWLREEDRWQNLPVAHNCIIRSIVYDADEKEVAREEKTFEVYNYNKGFKIEQEIEVENPNRWSDTKPYLYTLKSEIEWKGKVIDDKVTTIGIRKIEYSAEKGFLVNGERKILKGVCLHHDGGAVGVAVPKKVNRYRLMKLKELGCNAVRTSHNPFAPEFYDLCDELGIYLMNEIIDEWTSAWGYNFTDNNTSKAGNGFALYFKQWAETEMVDILVRDRNHPCVVMWSVGNELPELRSEPENARKVAEMLIDICQRKDNTRPVTFGNNGPHNGYKAENLDILGYNYVMGNHGFKVKGPGIYDEDHKKYPNRVFVGTETSQNEIDYYLAAKENPYVVGHFIWTGIQYFGEVKAPKAGQRGWVASLMDMSCNPLPEGVNFSVCWNETPKMYITSSELPFNADRKYQILPVTGERVFGNAADKFGWNWEKDGKKYVKVFSNCDEVELKLNGKSLGKQTNNFLKYYTEWELDYKAGELQAIGFNKGKKVMVETLETTSEPTKILAKPVFEGFKNDGCDVQLIEVKVCDKKGRLVSDATNTIKVEVSGSARLIAIDTGNLYYRGNYKVDNRDATNGYMTVTVQSTKGNQAASVKLVSEGLESAVINL